MKMTGLCGLEGDAGAEFLVDFVGCVGATENEAGAS